MKAFNINDFIKVKLTDHGKDIYYHQYDEFNKLYGGKIFKPRYPEVDSEGYTRIQLWQFMNIFGPHLYNGCRAIIENNRIYIRDEYFKNCDSSTEVTRNNG